MAVTPLDDSDLTLLRGFEKHPKQFKQTERAESMGGSSHLSYTLGALMIGGGAFAFMKKGSKASLIAGCTTGLLYIGSGQLIQNGQNKNGGSNKKRPTQAEEEKRTILSSALHSVPCCCLIRYDFCCLYS